MKLANVKVGRVSVEGEVSGCCFLAHRDNKVHFVTAAHVVDVDKEMTVQYRNYDLKVEHCKLVGNGYDVAFLTCGPVHGDRENFRHPKMAVAGDQKQIALVTQMPTHEPAVNKIDASVKRKTHNGSTQAGDSGSPIYDAHTGCVIGIHTGGADSHNVWCPFTTEFYVKASPFLVDGMASSDVSAKLL